MYVMDVLYRRDGGRRPQMIVTDTASYSDIVFGLLTLTGSQYAPRGAGGAFGLACAGAGPSDSGKELIVRALHLNSLCSRKPFLTLNCGAISSHLLESELFGHVRGAFRGAVGDKTGLLPAAHTGTVFLDEFGELPKELPVKLLRTLQFGEVQPVGAAAYCGRALRGGDEPGLEQEVAEGRFREDLLYRLNAVTLRIPGLKARRDDVLPLFYHFPAGGLGEGRPAGAWAARRLGISREWLRKKMQRYSLK